MARTPSNKLALGTSLPEVRLPDAISGDTVDLAALATGKKGLVVRG